MKKFMSVCLLLTLALLPACSPPGETAPDATEASPGPALENTHLTPAEQEDKSIITWQVDGGFAGFCDTLTVSATGAYTLKTCKGVVLTGQVLESQLELLQIYASRYAAFTQETSDPATADAMTLRLDFNGIGASEAGAVEKQAIGGLAAELATIARANATPDAERESARDALVAFLSALHSKDFALAATQYGGDTEALEDWEPDIQLDLPHLLERGCTRYGLQCMPVRAILYRGPDARGGYQFLVEFTAPDGSLFHQGPCCGDESEGPFPASFIFSVLKPDENWLVMNLPPYMP
jgi:hypothetical protein